MRKIGSRQGPLAVIVLLALFVALDLMVAVYHLSTGGRDSGIAEVVLAVVLVALVVPVIRPVREGERASYRGSTRLAAAVAVALAAAFVLFLAVYHFTHQGLPSGIIETCMSALLLMLAWTLYRYRGVRP